MLCICHMRFKYKLNTYSYAYEKNLPSWEPTLAIFLAYVGYCLYCLACTCMLSLIILYVFHLHQITFLAQCVAT